MIELERHIEILLLWNDCVIVPGFGGFTASHVPARFDENDNMFIPPVRTLGFNPKLNINDSLLAQSYTDACDISYPDALKRIAEEADELRQHIYNEGSYTLNDIGTLYLTEGGSIGFTPCEAGVLTPSLYSLNSFEMGKLSDSATKSSQGRQQEKAESQSETTVNVSTTQLRPTTETVEVDSADDEEEEKTVSIRLSVLRNVAAVLIAVVGFFALSTPVNNSKSMVQMSQIDYGVVSNLLSHSTATKKPAADVKLSKAQVGQDVKADKKETEAATNVATDKIEENYFCLVLASHVTLRNAEAFAAQLVGKGYRDTRVLREKGKSLKVVFGNYKTQAAAYNALNELCGDDVFRDAWVYNIR